jgi:hypothetical protein
MMTTHHPHMNNNRDFKIVVIQNFKNSKYNSKMFKFQKSVTKCKWVIMCMTYEQNFGL